jgi:hypothetical protein
MFFAALPYHCNATADRYGHEHIFHNSYHQKDRGNEFPTNSPVDSWAKTSHCFDILAETIDPCFIAENKCS